MEANNKNQENKDQNKPDNQNKDHASQGHTAGSSQSGSGTASKEPTLRSVTTDSSRVHKNSNDDLPTGGNIR